MPFHHLSSARRNSEDWLVQLQIVRLLHPLNGCNHLSSGDNNERLYFGREHIQYASHNVDLARLERLFPANGHTPS